MKHLTLALASIAAAAAALGPAPAATAGPLGTTIPSNCVRHTSFNGGADVPGDYRCAGLAIQFHTAGVANSPFPIWAGQWLFVDEQGQFRVGSCTLNRGVHPTIGSPSHPVTQAFPNDPTGAKGAYLTWKYGDTRDNLTAAAMWAVFHYYAQDAAGTTRASNTTAPLIPRLSGIAADSGRADLQATAQNLDDEATRYAGHWTLTLAVAADGTVTATLLSGATPVPDQQISVLVSGNDLPFVATTNAAGNATVTVPLPSGTVTVVATAASPGGALVYRGAPAEPDPQGAQTLVTGGKPARLTATQQFDVAPPTTTDAPTTTTDAPTTTTTTTVPSTTDAPATTAAPTTTVAPTTVPTTTVPTTTDAPTTEASTTTEATSTTESTSTTTTLAPIIPSTTTAQNPPPLPHTGGGAGGVAYLATALLVGGVGLLGTLRRREQLAYNEPGDAG